MTSSRQGYLVGLGIMGGCLMLIVTLCWVTNNFAPCSSLANITEECIRFRSDHYRVERYCDSCDCFHQIYIPFDIDIESFAFKCTKCGDISSTSTRYPQWVREGDSYESD